jgi:hypothetical protein
VTCYICHPLGFGEMVTQSLPGHIGHPGVGDCIAELDAAVAGGEDISL